MIISDLDPLYKYLWFKRDIRNGDGDGKVDSDLLEEWFKKHGVPITQENSPYSMYHKISMNDEDYIFLCMKYL